MTTDNQKAFDFYRKLFGWEQTGEMDMGGGQMYRMYGKGQPFGGMFNRHGDMMNMRPFWLVYIHVKDVKKAVDIATRNGAFVQRPPMEIPGGGTIAILGDPQGAAFALHSAAQSSTSSSGGAKKGGTRSKTRAATKKSARPAKRAAAKKAGTKKRGGAKKGAAKRAGAKKGGAKKRGGAKRAGATKTRGATKKRSATKKSARRRR
jgi:predicted enzyme related to lactoylglutathione lyase